MQPTATIDNAKENERSYTFNKKCGEVVENYRLWYNQANNDAVNKKLNAEWTKSDRSQSLQANFRINGRQKIWKKGFAVK